MAKKPCEYCEEEMTNLISDLGDYLTMEIYQGHMISAIAFFKTESGEQEQATIEIPMDYCPCCGRKLV